MKRLIQAVIVAIMVSFLFATLLQGKAEYTKKEGKGCVTCHVKPGSKDLNDVGKCYEKSKSLKECLAPKG
jgi:hypothetical protein